MNTIPPNETLNRLKARFLVLLWIVPLFYLPAMDDFYREYNQYLEWYWWDILYYYYGHILFIIAIFLLVIYSKLKWRSLLGKSITRNEIISGLKLTFFILLFSVATAYLLFYPLSFVAPEFVSWWYIYPTNLIFRHEFGYPILANTLNFLSLVVFAPVIEEVVFRGFLLHRWNYKWGLTKAVLFSSFLFGIVHPDPIGAIAFGIAMSILYLRTQSLFTPIICHSANNMLVWLIEAGYLAVEGPAYTYTLETFQHEWYIGLACGVVTIIWAGYFFSQSIKPKKWELPAIQTIK